MPRKQHLSQWRQNLSQLLLESLFLKKDFVGLCTNLEKIPKHVLNFGKHISQQPTVRYGLVSHQSLMATSTLAIPKPYSLTLDTLRITVGRLICDMMTPTQRLKRPNILRKYWRWYVG